MLLSGYTLIHTDMSFHCGWCTCAITGLQLDCFATDMPALNTDKYVITGIY